MHLITPLDLLYTVNCKCLKKTFCSLLFFSFTEVPCSINCGALCIFKNIQRAWHNVRAGFGAGELTLSEIIELIEKDKFYVCREWKQKRKDILDRDNNECQKCKYVHHTFGRASTVHHIKHLKEHPELAFDDDNLISLCYDCHNEEHPEKFRNFFREQSKKRWDDEKW